MNDKTRVNIHSSILLFIEETTKNNERYPSFHAKFPSIAHSLLTILPALLLPSQSYSPHSFTYYLFAAIIANKVVSNLPACLSNCFSLGLLVSVFFVFFDEGE